MSTVRENLIAARALIDTPEKWGKGNETYTRKAGCPLCAHGALLNAGIAGPMDECREALANALPDGWERGYIGKDRSFVPEFNDHPDTTHADIMALFDRAIAARGVERQP